MEEKRREVDDAEESGAKASSKRLVADPSISVDDLGKVIGKFLEYKDTKKVFRTLISPPPGRPTQLDWHTPVHAEWVAKACGLLYDLLDLAANTKLLGTKVIASFRFLHANQSLLLPETRTQAHRDRMDMAIKLLLSFLRPVKMSEALKTRVTRMLGASDVMGINLCLDKIELLSWYVGDDDNEATPCRHGYPCLLLVQ